ncbi:MAG: glutathione S-transferase N-terminal domain-containing protein [Halobacteriaceae archaeon]
MSNLVLYELDGCPFCLKVRRTLEELDLEYESRSVPAAHADRDEVKSISGQTGVPVLVDETHNVEGMPESADIIAYLKETYGEDT